MYFVQNSISEYIKRKLYQRCYRNRIKFYSVTLIQMHLNNISSLCTIWKCINVPVVKLNSTQFWFPYLCCFPSAVFYITSSCYTEHYICIKMLWKIYSIMYVSKWKMLCKLKYIFITFNDIFFNIIFIIYCWSLPFGKQFLLYSKYCDIVCCCCYVYNIYI